ncbi:MAG: hypothetical protein LUD16_03520, partial [Lachnospiraceae bacterium]|nr:hypothetical protein [Lachnospiraceae bacterium]
PCDFLGFSEWNLLFHFSTFVRTGKTYHFGHSSEQHQNEKTDCADLSAKGWIFILGWAERPSATDI